MNPVTQQRTSPSGLSSDDSCSTVSPPQLLHPKQQQSQVAHPKEVRFATDPHESSIVYFNSSFTSGGGDSTTEHQQQHEIPYPSVAETIDLPPPENDASKSREDLLVFVALLRDRLVSLTIALSGERVLRKKKDKTIFKLAKQYNVKAEEVLEKEKEINVLLAHQATLETEASLLKKQLCDLHHDMDKASREHHVELTTLQNSNRILIQKYDDRIASIQSYHSKQCEELRRQILTSQLETDRLRLKYASLQMKFYPKRADKIVKRTIKEAIKNTADDISHDSDQGHSSLKLDKAIYYDLEERRAIQFWRVLGFFFCLFILPAIALCHSYHIISFDVLCAPSPPYTIFDSSSLPGSYHEAPWWLPSSIFSDIFTSTQRYKIYTVVCEDRPYTRLEWIDMGLAGYKLIVWDNSDPLKDTETEEQDHVSSSISFPRLKFKKNPILLEKRTTMAKIFGNTIEFTNWSGKVEKKKGPWTLHTR